VIDDQGSPDRGGGDIEESPSRTAEEIADVVTFLLSDRAS